MFKAVQFIAPGRNKLCALLFDIIKQPVNGYGGLVGGAGALIFPLGVSLEYRRIIS